MTVSSTTSRVVYSGNGVTTVWPFAFKVATAADLVVIYTDTTGTDFTLSTSQYTATGFNLDAGGNVTYPTVVSGASPIATGTKLTIYRSVALTQPASISNQGAMWPQVIEAALDRLTYMAQSVSDAVSRALVISPTDSAALNVLPNATERANSFLAFDANGQPIAATSISIATVTTWLAQNFLLVGTSAATALAALGGLASSLFTTRGDILVRGASVPQRLGLGTSGQVLSSNGTDAVWAAPSSVSTSPTTQTFTSGSGATYTRPAGCLRIEVRFAGGGGGGGGAGGTLGPTGATGGTTSFNSIAAAGGVGGAGTTGAASVAGGAGGSAGTGTATLRVSGQNGADGLFLSGASINYGGAGGSAPFFGGGGPASGATAGKPAIANTGGGGSGASASGTTNPAAGGGSGEYVELTIASPAATYTYTVGAGGAGGIGTGAAAATGGAGAAGVITVKEFYNVF